MKCIDLTKASLPISLVLYINIIVIDSNTSKALTSTSLDEVNSSRQALLVGIYTVSHKKTHQNCFGNIFYET